MTGTPTGIAPSFGALPSSSCLSFTTAQGDDCLLSPFFQTRKPRLRAEGKIYPLMSPGAGTWTQDGLTPKSTGLPLTPHCLFTCVCTAPGETDYRTEDLSPCSLWCPPPPHCCPRQAAGGAEGRWQQVRWPHLPVVRRGHVPLAYPVAVVGVGVVCISNPLLGWSRP